MLMDFFQTFPAAAAVNRNSQTDRLMVVGTIDPESKEVELAPLFVMPDTAEPDEHVTGDYAVVLRDEAEKELVRYAFAPRAAGTERIRGSEPETGDFIELLFIEELVPFADDTVHVDIEDAGGRLHRVSARPGVPNVPAGVGARFH